MAEESPGWGYDRIVGAMASLGHRLSDQTVGNILRRHGLSAAPMRKQVICWRDLSVHTWKFCHEPALEVRFVRKAMGTTSFFDHKTFLGMRFQDRAMVGRRWFWEEPLDSSTREPVYLNGKPEAADA
jgi:hypothetical protein